MIVEAIKKGDGYFIPIKGTKEKIRIYIEEDVEGLDILSLFSSMKKESNEFSKITKDEFRELYGEELYRQYLLLDENSMEENWEYLVKTKKDWGDGFEAMEEAVSNWDKK